MPDALSPDQQRLLLDQARRSVRLETRDLWLRYFATGGVVGEGQVSDYLDGAGTLVDGEYNVLAYAVNECLLEHGRSAEVPYRDV